MKHILIFSLILRTMCGVCGVWVTQEGAENRDVNAKILVSNYTTTLDHLALDLVLPVRGLDSNSNGDSSSSCSWRSSIISLYSSKTSLKSILFSNFLFWYLYIKNGLITFWSSLQNLAAHDLDSSNLCFSVKSS